MSETPSLAIASLLKREARPIFLLGAGCSLRSGIPTTDVLVGQIAKWGYCVANARDFDDPSVVRTDWWPWLEKQSWYRGDVSLPQLYPKAVEALLRPQHVRREFFRRILNPGMPLSRGYEHLAQLFARKVLLTVLTTNFDQLLASACRSTASVHVFDEVRTPSDFHMISTNPDYPQIIYLHGSVEHYTDQNLEKETQSLNQDLVEHLVPLLRDHPLVVLGYRGAEASIMQHLLIDQAERCANYRRGIYWCVRNAGDPTKGLPLLETLVATVGSNFSFVQIAGFDELMAEISGQLPSLQTKPAGAGRRVAADSTQAPVHDLAPSPIFISQLDNPLVRAKVSAYCDAVRLPKPALSTELELVSAMSDRNLAIQRTDGWVATQGGRLLFVRSQVDQLPDARVVVSISGDPSWISDVIQSEPNGEAAGNVEITIEGNLWQQLERLLSLLAQVNRPFRLKGHASREAYPYPPLALKEIATNLLAHRDYRVDGVAHLSIFQSRLVFSNPGGLTDHVRLQLQNQQLQEVIQASARGIKGYRNPVVADFFFSAGAMDKEGSGLPDVVSEAANNLNALTFGPNVDNDHFVVEIAARPEALTVDPKTRTSKSIQREARFSPNLLSVERWPDQIWRIPATIPYSEARNLREGGAPPFFLHEDAIWTFASPRDESAGAFLQVASSSGSPSNEAFSEILTQEWAKAALPKLLNIALERHLDALGMAHRFISNSIRAYFEVHDGKARSVQYRGLFKQAERTVTKPVISKTTGNTLWWEHKSVALRFEQFGASWALSLLPTYVFTKTGAGEWIEAHRIGPRTTKRTARDYNPTVLHSMVFWSRVLANNSESSFSLSLDGNETLVASQRPSIEVSPLVPIVTFDKQQDIASGPGIDGSMTDATFDVQEADENSIAASLADDEDEDGPI